MTKDALPQATTSETLCKFLKACALLGEVYNTDTAFATMLMPASTERFLEESAQRLTMIEDALRS